MTSQGTWVSVALKKRKECGNHLIEVSSMFTGKNFFLK